MDFKFRGYDSRIARFRSNDPLAKKFPYNSPYAFAENKLGLGKEFEGLELVPNNTGYFGVEPKGGGNGGGDDLSIGVKPRNLPDEFKDEAGGSLLDPGSVGLGPHGKFSDNGPSFRPGSRLPENPKWEMSNPEFPDPEGAPEAPGLKGLQVINEAGKYAQLHKDTKIWNAYGNLGRQINAFDAATKIDMPFLGLTKSDRAKNRAAYINFAYDGTLPPYDPNMSLKGNILNSVNFIKVGVEVLKQNGIDVRPQTTQMYNNLLNTYNKMNESDGQNNGINLNKN